MATSHVLGPEPETMMSGPGGGDATALLDLLHRERVGRRAQSTWGWGIYEFETGDRPDRAPAPPLPAFLGVVWHPPTAGPGDSNGSRHQEEGEIGKGEVSKKVFLQCHTFTVPRS